MDELVDFLKAQLDEDEQIARNTFENDYAQTTPEWTEIWSGTVNTGDELLATGDRALSDHIERWDPARALAEVEAKRSIIACYEQAICAARRPPLDNTLGKMAVLSWQAAVRCLALAYRTHPDFMSDWLLESGWAPEKA